MSKKAAKTMKFAGKALVFAGAVAGDTSTVCIGSSIEDWGAAFSNNGVAISFAANELVSVPVKLSWNGTTIVEDKKA